MSGKEFLSQLANLNESCRKAIEEEDYQRLQALMQLKRELLALLRKTSFVPEDLPEIHRALKEEEELASLALIKKKHLEERLVAGVLH